MEICMLEAWQPGWGWRGAGSRREPWQRLGETSWAPGRQTLLSLSRPLALTGQPVSHPSALPAALFSPASLFLALVPLPPLPGPWMMSTGELETRTLVCFASLAPSRQCLLPEAEEGAAPGPACLPPHSGQSDKRRALHFSPVWHHHPLIPWCPVHASHPPWHGSESRGRRGALPPPPGDPSVIKDIGGYVTWHGAGSLTCGHHPIALGKATQLGPCLWLIPLVGTEIANTEMSYAG